MSRTFTVAAVQLDCQPNRKTDNLQHAEAMVR